MEQDLNPERRWFPVCRGEEAARRHIVHTALLGQEIAVWRADGGLVNAWENRCPHRGIRLSVGSNLGDRLKCRYHGWSYESDSGQCIDRPAHPGEKPPSLVRARRFSCAEVAGYVWVRLAGEGDGGEGPVPGTKQPGLTLRSVPVRARASTVLDALARHPSETPQQSPVEVVDPYTVCTVDARAGEIRYALQPVSADETVIHAALADAPPAADRNAVLRRENDRLRAVRDAIETQTPS